MTTFLNSGKIGKMRIIVLTCLSLLLSAPIYAIGEWISDIKSGCKVWNYHPTTNETITYIGNCVDGKANGKGSITWYKDGNKIGLSKGEYIDGRINGNCSYTGFESGIMTRHIKGECKDGLLNGKGSETRYKNSEIESVYIGGHKDGKFHGEGTYTTIEGGKGIHYRGEFNDGVPCRNGLTTVYIDKITIMQIEGDFMHGSGNGLVKLYENGKVYNQYEGALKNNVFHGKGTLIDADGNKYIGSFQNGKKHGKGEFTSPYGNSYKGLWENGVRIKIF